MSMFPHVVTLYNTESIELPENNFEPTLVNHITVLRGVLLDASKGANVNKSGLEGADAVNLYIPLSVKAVDGVTGAEKRYIGHVEFWRADDKSTLWTLSVSRNCFFVKGEVIHPEWKVQALKAAYDSVYDVNRVDFYDFGGDMSHWEVGGA